MAAAPTVPAKKRRWPLVVAALVLALCGGAAYFWFAVLHPAPRAHRHVPKGSNMVMRADAVEIATFKPVRDHLWPVLLEQSGDVKDKPKRLERIEEETGIELTDMREAIIASVDGTAWVLVVGGNFEKGRFVPGLQRAFEAEGLKGWSEDGELLVHSFGPAVGQADDGTLVFGTSAAITRAALPESDEDAPLPVPVDGGLSFLVNHTAWKSVVGRIPVDLPGTNALGKIDEVSGKMTLSEDPQLDLEVLPKDGEKAEDLARTLDSSLAKMRLALLLVPSDLGGGKRAIQNASVKADGDKVRIAAPWPYEALDRAAKEAADLLRARR